MSNKQTAVEWLVEQLDKENMFMYLFTKQISQAIEMEKEQKQLDYIAGHDLCRCVTDHPDEALEIFEEYYNDTYGK